ncbi:hypothetical protein F4824DRAFT_465284 [Ustulina deusta]|nr:hypothetical protein F4824DRAFT_465284 [Ustulina deusta]
MMDKTKIPAPRPDPRPEGATPNSDCDDGVAQFEGQCCILDTSDGTVILYYVTQFLYEPTYSGDDSRAWCDRLCAFETHTPTDQLEEWRCDY